MDPCDAQQILPLGETDKATLATIKRDVATMSSSQAIPLIKQAPALVVLKQVRRSSRRSIPGTPTFVTPRLQVVTLQAMDLPLRAKLGEFIRDKDPKKDQDLRFNACHVLRYMGRCPENHK